MTFTAPNPYAEQSVQTAGPATLVTMLYDRLLTAVSRSQRAGGEQGVGGYATINSELQRAQDILTELRHSLDHEAGGEMAGNLDALYAFCIDRVVAANLRKDTGDLPVVTTVISELRDAWAQACDPASLPLAQADR